MIKNNILTNEYFIATLKTSYDREYFEDLNGIRITIDSDFSFTL
jgi:TRAP-type uncharacterized transport system substrate-binding protein